ncbi:MAG TPA: hypothetical protein VNK82_10855 [Terriglobales bacterium]|nr:hypothetical protein [Terriglobales bacterium]
MELPTRNNPHDPLFLALLAGLGSVAAFLFYWRQDALLLYGDAVAHLNIARRVVDSRTPGPFQLGSVWLPLPHLLMLPGVMSDWAWRTGFAGALVSMASYVAGTLGVFRLARGFGSRAATWVGALVFAANPNLLYMQATAMTEPLYLALFVWATVHVAEFAATARNDHPRPRSQARRSLERCGLLLAAAMLTRYDAWFASAFFVPVALWSYASRRRMYAGSPDPELRRSLRNFVLITAAAPLLWMAYNWGVFGNPLDFLTGPYSARAIAERTTPEGSPPHPGYHAPGVAAAYFLKAAKLNLGDDRWGDAMLAVAVLGFLAALFRGRGRSALLLWLPLPFYVLSVAYASVPIFLPVWWPFSFYNVRYGLQLLPAVAVFLAVATSFVLERRPRRRWLAVLAAALLVGMSSISAWRAVPICLREARANSHARIAFERKLAAELERLNGDAVLMMHVGSHGGALQRASIPLRRVIHEGNYPDWRVALNDPAAWADFLVAVEGDAVEESAAKHAGDVEAVATVETPGQPRAVIFRTRRRP